MLEGKGAGLEELWQSFHQSVLDLTNKIRQASPDADFYVGLAAFPRAVQDFIR